MGAENVQKGAHRMPRMNTEKSEIRAADAAELGRGPDAIRMPIVEKSVSPKYSKWSSKASKMAAKTSQIAQKCTKICTPKNSRPSARIFIFHGQTSTPPEFGTVHRKIISENGGRWGVGCVLELPLGGVEDARDLKKQISARLATYFILVSKKSCACICLYQHVYSCTSMSIFSLFGGKKTCWCQNRHAGTDMLAADGPSKESSLVSKTYYKS